LELASKRLTLPVALLNSAIASFNHLPTNQGNDQKAQSIEQEQQIFPF